MFEGEKKERGGEIVNKKLLLPVCMILCVILLPMARADNQIKIHFEGKAAFAIRTLSDYYIEVFGAVDGLLNLPCMGAPLKGMYGFAIFIYTPTHGIVDCIVMPLEKGQFKWSMNHAVLMIEPYTDVWDTMPTTMTCHINIKDVGCLDLDHVVANVGARFAQVIENCVPTDYCGIVVHAAGTLTFGCA